MTPLAEILQLLRSTSARGFASRHPDHDLILLEPYEKDRTYNATSPLHPGAQVRFIPRAVGKPVPVGRDSRAQVMLDHPAVSRLHVVLAFTQSGWKAMDRSSNGSWLNEERLPKEQAVPLAYGLGLRMGRALVLRLFTLDEFYRYANQAVTPPAQPRPAPGPTDRGADTWRIPAQYVQAAQAASQAKDPFGENTLEIDFNFEGPPPAVGAPTVRIKRDALGPSLGQGGFPAPSGPPQPPRAPRPPKKVSDGDIEYEFEFDIEPDGRGGF